MGSEGRVTFNYAFNKKAAKRIANYLVKHGWRDVEISKLKKKYKGKNVYCVSGRKWKRHYDI